ncbi:hypothetical protein [Paracoccus beibuensis]|uniref:hypothetical protein n=1 Tax=Paracoccus beibuensis TaxID=547602 RepID=UPI0022405A55|nr:hypothetical protein [Paracoccus beibuensis]
MRLSPRITAASLALVVTTAVVVLDRREPLAPRPAHADEAGIVATPVIGDVPREGLVTPIERPGIFGLGISPSGSRYAMVGGYLVRIDLKSGKIVSILRRLPTMQH